MRYKLLYSFKSPVWNMPCSAENQAINENGITWYTSLKKNDNHVFQMCNIISVEADHVYGLDSIHHFTTIH